MKFKLDGMTAEETLIFLLGFLIFCSIVWLIIVFLFVKKSRKSPIKNLNITFRTLYWCAFSLTFVAQIEQLFGANYTVNNYGSGAMAALFAFVWPVNFSVSVGELLLKKSSRKQQIFAILRIILSFALLVWQIFNAIF